MLGRAGLDPKRVRDKFSGEYLVALAQEDMKKLIAYSSVAHMGFVTMGIFAATTQGKPGGYAVPNDVVERALSDSSGPVGTGPCTR